MASELFVDNITGKTGTSGGAPITLSGDTATLGSGVVMASSGVTVRNVTNIALASDQTLGDSTTLTTFFSPTYTPLFSGSKVQGILSLQGFFQGYNNRSSGRKKFQMEFTGNDITDITINNANVHRVGNYDWGGSGSISYHCASYTGPLITTTGTSTITANCKLSNEHSSNSNYEIRGNNTLEETFFTWIEYK